MGLLNHERPLRLPENRRILDLPHGIETKAPGIREDTPSGTVMHIDARLSGASWAVAHRQADLPGRRCARSTPLTPRACRPPSAGTASAFLRIDAGTCLDPWLRGLPAADG